MKKSGQISSETIKRLIIYLRYLELLKRKGVKVISSEDITSFLNVQPSQFRKDLSFFGGFGKRGVGYNVDSLLETIKRITGADKSREVMLIGVGKLGSALLQYTGFKKINANIVACFDNNPDKIGRVIENMVIGDIENAKETIKEKGIKVAILCVPVEQAQDVAEKMVKFGIKGILNFAPAILFLPQEVYVSNVDMASELGNIIYYLKD